MVEYAEVIDYASPPPARPGLVTALGVMSIIVGSLGLMASLGCGLQVGTFGYFVLDGSFGTTNNITPLTVADEPQVRLDGDSAAVVVEALNQHATMPESQQEVLRRVMPYVDVPFDEPDNGHWTVEHVTDQLSPAAATTAPAGPYVSSTYATTSGDMIMAATFAGNTSGSMTSGGKFFTYSEVSTDIIEIRDSNLGFGDKATLPVLVAAFIALVLGLILAAWLLTAGIRTLSRPERGIRMHRKWLIPKLFHVVLLLGVTAWTGITLAEAGLPDLRILADGSTEMPSIFDEVGLIVFYAFASVVLLLAYPVAVYITLRAKTIRDFIDEGSPSLPDRSR